MFKFKSKKQTKKSFKKNNLLYQFIFSKFGMATIIFVVIFGFLYAATINFITNSDYFKVESVEVKGQNLSTLFIKKEIFEIGKGRNILTLDLQNIHKKILSEYPEIQELKVVRILPDKLVIKIKARRPVAQISHSSKFYPVDRELVVLSNISYEAYKGLPVITGINMRLNDYIGRQCNSRQLENAFMLLDAINSSGLLSDHDLAMIDASDYKNLSFYIEDGIEVKIGSENFENRLSLLKKTFLDTKLNKSEIKYLDLRFEDVTIGPKVMK